MMMTPRELLVPRGSMYETLAYNDDTKGYINTGDVTLAYDDDTKGCIGTRDVTLAYDDDTKGTTMTMF